MFSLYRSRSILVFIYLYMVTEEIFYRQINQGVKREHLYSFWLGIVFGRLLETEGINGEPLFGQFEIDLNGNVRIRICVPSTKSEKQPLLPALAAGWTNLPFGKICRKIYGTEVNICFGLKKG